MPGDDVTLLHPPAVPGPLWWIVVGTLVLVALALGILVGLIAVHRPRPVAGTVTVEQLRTATLTAISDTAARHARGEVTGADACQQLSRTVRRFVGQCTDGDADFATADQLVLAAVADHRLDPAARFTADIRRACFAAGAGTDVAGFTERARKVVEAWR